MRSSVPLARFSRSPCIASELDAKLLRDYVGRMNIDITWQDVARRELARPLACEILATCASTRGQPIFGITDEVGDPDTIEEEDLALASELALEAWKAVAAKRRYTHHPAFVAYSWDTYYEICAEAEAILQCGWCPGWKLEQAV